MATKLSQLTETTTLADNDLVYVVKPSEPIGSQSKGITKTNFLNGVINTSNLGYETVLDLTDFDALITGSTSGTWLILDDFVLDADKTIPANVTLEFRGGVIDISLYDLIGTDTHLIADEKEIIDVSGGGLLAGTWSADYLVPTNFGAFENGTIDDTMALIALFYVADMGMSKLKLGYQKSYKVTSSLTFENLELDINGSEIIFVLTGSELCLLPKNNTVVKNGKVTNTGSGFSGSGEYQCPIMIGRYGLGTSYNNIKLYNLEIASNRTDGNGIFVTSESYNIDIKNINFPSSSTIGRPILIHWGNADNPTTETYHPYNINIENIYVDTMTYVSIDASVVFISGAYNVTTRNIKAVSLSYERGLYAVFSGDYGKYYARTEIQEKVNTNLYAYSLSSDYCAQKAVWTDGKPTLSPVNDILPSPFVDGINAVGNNADVGISINKTFNGIFKNIKVSNFLIGVVIGEATNNITLEDSTVNNNRETGILVTNSTTPPENINILKCLVYMNAQDGTSDAGIRCNEAHNVSIQKCIIGEAGTETQIWGVRVDTSSTRIRIKDNHIINHKTGGVGFSIGSSTTYELLSTFENNTSVSGLTITAGMNPLIVSTIVKGSLTLREAIGSAAPTAGDWIKGDKVYDETPSSSGYLGWVCVTSGTAGTWKGFGLIEA